MTRQKKQTTTITSKNEKEATDKDGCQIKGGEGGMRVGSRSDPARKQRQTRKEVEGVNEYGAEKDELAANGEIAIPARRQPQEPT